MLQKIIVIWMVFLALHFGSLLLPHRQYSELGSVNVGLQFLLFLLCFEMARKDVKVFKPALINLSIFFGFSVLLYLSIFVGTVLFKGEQYASVYYHEYVNKFGLNAVLVLAVVYLIMDNMFQKLTTISKYLITLVIAGAILVPLYYPYFRDPLHLYRTEEYSRYLDLKSAHDTILKEKGTEPTEAEIVRSVIMSKNQHSATVDAEDFA